MSRGHIDDEYYRRTENLGVIGLARARENGKHFNAPDDSVPACELDPDAPMPEGAALFFEAHCEGCVAAMEARLRDEPHRFDADATQYIARFVVASREFAAEHGWA